MAPLPARSPKAQGEGTVVASAIPDCPMGSGASREHFRRLSAPGPSERQRG